MAQPQSGLLQSWTRYYRWIAGAALIWAVGNAAWVYLIRHGAGMYRLESAAILFVALLLPAFFSGSAEPRAGASWPARHALIGACIIVALWLITYLPLLGFPFLSDDYVFLGRYQSPAGVLTTHQFFRPAFAGVFFILARLGGGSPVPFHVASLMLHLGSAWLVWWFVRRLTGESAAALIAFALFLLSPLQLESVLWVSGLQELLWSFLTLAALRIYVGTQVLSAWRVAGTSALVSLALLSKETAVCSLALLVGADAVLYRMKRGRLLLAGYVAFGAILAAYLLARTSVAPVDGSFLPDSSRYFVKQFLATPYRFFCQPWSVPAVAVPDVIAFLVTVAVLVLAFVAIVIRKIPGRALVGPAVILLSTIPLLGYFFVGADLRSARYLYFPAFGWSLLLAELLTNVVRRRSASTVILAGMVVGLWALLVMNLRPWKVAGEVIDAFETGLQRGTVAADVLKQWEGTHGTVLDLKDGLPVGYQGVSIFLNGYPEFERLHRPR